MDGSEEKALPDMLKMSLSYGLATAQANLGFKVARRGWIGSGKADNPDKFIFMLKKEHIKIKNIKLWNGKNDSVLVSSQLMFKSVKHKYASMFTPSSADLSEADWFVVDPAYTIYKTPTKPKIIAKGKTWLDHLIHLLKP